MANKTELPLPPPAIIEMLSGVPVAHGQDAWLVGSPSEMYYKLPVTAPAEDEIDELNENYVSPTAGKRPSLSYYDNVRSRIVDRYSWGSYAGFGVYD